MTEVEEFNTWCDEVDKHVTIWENKLELDEPVLIAAQLLKRVIGKASDVAGLEIVLMEVINQRWDTSLTFSDSAVVSLFVNGLMKNVEVTNEAFGRLIGLKGHDWFIEVSDLINLCREKLHVH